MQSYHWALALHLVSIVSWFAGLFYLGRLFIYHAEALEKPEPARSVLASQYTLMEGRVWRAILSPAGGATFLSGAWLLYLTGAWRLPWFHVKLVFLVALFAYHGVSNRFRLDLQAGKSRTVRFFRFWNESATLLLFLIVFTAKFKTPMGAVYGLATVLALTAVGMAFFLRGRRAKRERP
jgi:putative membrane protein